MGYPHNSDAEALIFHGALADRVQTVRDRLPRLRTLIQLTTTEADQVPLLSAAHAYEALLAAHAPAARIARSPDDFVFLYTGGTTGLPKGVMWRRGDLFTVLSQSYQAIGEKPATPAEVGLLAVAADSGIPIGYYKDDVKTAATFRVIDGIRYSFPGDWAKVEPDGTVTLLGRGSVCINSGGEKVFPEEVEEALKLHPAVEDCTVVGVPDEVWGEVIVAVVSVAAGAAAGPVELISSARSRLAAFKAPKHIVFVERVLRSPAGKADYRWAKDTARQALGR